MTIYVIGMKKPKHGKLKQISSKVDRVPLCKNPSSMSIGLVPYQVAFLSLKKPPSIVDTMPIATPQGTLDFKSVDTITFVGASSNTVIDTTTGSLGVGVDGNGPTSNLHVVGHTRLEGDINMLHTSNTASIKLNSNVVTEFPRSKKLIKYPRVALSTNAGNHSALGSGYTQDGYTVKVSSELAADYVGTKAFTNTNLNNSDTWISDQLKYSSGNPVSVTTNVNKFGQNGEWLEIKLPNKIKLSSTRIFSRRQYFTERNDTADIWASNTGTDGDWVKLTTINFNDTYTDVIPMVAEIDTQNYYSYFAIQITEVGWTNGTYVNIGEWELFGIPEYDPEADGVDVTVKSVPNVPNTDWLEVYYDAKNYSGSGDVQDETTNNRDAEMNATFDNGEIKAFSFSGAHTSNVTTSDHGLGTGDVPYTVSYWFKRIQQRNSYDYLYIMGSGGSIGQASLMWILNDQLHLDHWSTNTRYNEPIQNNRWYHVAAGHRGGEAVTNDFLFIDGQNAGVSVSTPQTFNLQGSKLTLGTSHNTTNEFLEGSIANFRVFNRALTSDEIYQLYAYQKEDFGHGDLGMTLKAGRLGIGTSEPKAALDVRGDVILTGNFSQIITGVGLSLIHI